MIIIIPTSRLSLQPMLLIPLAYLLSPWVSPTHPYQHWKMRNIELSNFHQISKNSLSILKVAWINQASNDCYFSDLLDHFSKIPHMLYLFYTTFVIIQLWDINHISPTRLKNFHNQSHNRHCKFWFPNFVNGSSIKVQNDFYLLSLLCLIHIRIQFTSKFWFFMHPWYHS